MRTFTKDETYALTEQFKYGSAMADRDMGRADAHKRSVRYNRGTLTERELTTAYALGYSGCTSLPALFGYVIDAHALPSVAVHAQLGYMVTSDWRKRALALVSRPTDPHYLRRLDWATDPEHARAVSDDYNEGAKLAAEWLAEVEAADEAMGVQS